MTGFVNRREFLTTSAKRSGAAALLGIAAASGLNKFSSPCLAAEAASQKISTVQSNWVEVRRDGPFTCHAAFSLSNHEALFAELPQLENELVRVLAMSRPRQPIDLYLYKDESQHRAALQQQFPQVPYRRALFVKQGNTSSVYAFQHAELAVDIRHECTHALLHTDLSMVPLWLDEGLAEYFEMAADRRACGHPHFKSLRWNMRLGIVRDLKYLENLRELSDMENLEYRYSWAWVHFFLHGPKPVYRELVHYLADIRNQRPPGKLAERIHRVLPNATEQMVKHFKHWPVRAG